MTDFRRADAERRLGPAAVEAVRRLVDAAPPLRNEQRVQLRAVFDSVPPAPTSNLATPRAA